MLLRTRDME